MTTIQNIARWLGALSVAQGLALVIGGRDTVRAIGQLGPTWYHRRIRPLNRVSPGAIRTVGALEVAFGLGLLALAPSIPRLLRQLALIARDPARAFWELTAARPAERDFDELLHQFVPPGARILDLGAGDGENLARLVRLGLPFGSYVGVDTSPRVLRRACARFDGMPKVAFLPNDLLNEPLPPGEFDLILSTWALDRLSDPFALIVRAMRQLRHGGHAMLLFASLPRDWRANLARFVAKLSGRRLYPASIYHGLPSFTAQQEFADGLISLVILESPAPRPPLVSAAPPEQAQP